jgi:hypothetical protein
MLACRSVSYLPLRSGTFVSDPFDGGQELRGVELMLDLERNVATLRDGDARIDFALTRVADREQWVGGCGTMSSYAMLEPALIEPTAFEIRGRRVRYDRVQARCYAEGVWLDSTSPEGSLRWIFGPLENR